MVRATSAATPSLGWGPSPFVSALRQPGPFGCLLPRSPPLLRRQHKALDVASSPGQLPCSGSVPSSIRAADGLDEEGPHLAYRAFIIVVSLTVVGC